MGKNRKKHKRKKEVAIWITIVSQLLKKKYKEIIGTDIFLQFSIHYFKVLPWWQGMIRNHE